MSNNRLLHSVWDNAADIITRVNVPVSKYFFDDLAASIFCPGPFYFYIVDFFDRKIKFMNPNIKDVLGLDPEIAQFDDIIARIHPDDMNFVATAEYTVLNYLYKKIDREKVTRYKMSYCFRFKVGDGSYQLFQHQAILLSTDDQGKFSNSLNIHSNISHITSQNNYKVSLIGLMDEPSYMNMDVFQPEKIEATDEPLFTSREREIIRLMSQGLKTKAIAAKLGIALHTALTHRKNIMSKSRCSNTAELIAMCIRNGWA
jgi:DNA-binding CsgD family transcriptional regulator